MYESKSKMFGLALSPTEREAIRKLAQLEGGSVRPPWCGG